MNVILFLIRSDQSVPRTVCPDFHSILWHILPLFQFFCCCSGHGHCSNFSLSRV